jgi:hypothetical protein
VHVHSTVLQLALIKAYIRSGDYQSALNTFNTELIDSSLVSFQREKLRSLVIKYVEHCYGFSTNFGHNAKAIEVRTKADAAINSIPGQ